MYDLGLCPGLLLDIYLTIATSLLELLATPDMCLVIHT